MVKRDKNLSCALCMKAFSSQKWLDKHTTLHASTLDIDKIKKKSKLVKNANKSDTKILQSNLCKKLY